MGEDFVRGGDVDEFAAVIGAGEDEIPWDDAVLEAFLI